MIVGMTSSESKKANIGKKNSQFMDVWKRLRKNKMAMAGLAVLAIIIFMCVFADFLTPYGYDDQNIDIMFQSPSASHLFGTDQLGRDILTRLMYGGRISLRVGLISVAVSCLLGSTVGAIAGYYGGKVDQILMRILDIFMAIPNILLAIAIAATLGSGINNAIIAIGISGIPGYARMMRASILSVREMEYIEAARSINARDARIIMFDIIPNVLSPIIIQITLGVAGAILTAASLSFIGLGVQPPYPEWGAMLSTGRQFIRDYMQLVLYPGLCIMLTVFSLNMLGDGLRDALDPRLKN